VFFWKKWTRKKSRGGKPPVRAAVAGAQRQSYHASVEFPVAYVAEGRAGSRAALANDLSAGGLRLIGDEDLPEQTHIELRFTLPNDAVAGVHVEKEIVETTSRGRVTKKVMVPPDAFREMTVRAKVAPAFFSLRRRKFAHAVEFVGLEEKLQEEIQRFIHVWQIRLLRERRARLGE
jgi:hypothetical protein